MAGVSGDKGDKKVNEVNGRRQLVRVDSAPDLHSGQKVTEDRKKVPILSRLALLAFLALVNAKTKSNLSFTFVLFLVVRVSNERTEGEREREYKRRSRRIMKREQIRETIATKYEDDDGPKITLENQMKRFERR